MSPIDRNWYAVSFEMEKYLRKILRLPLRFKILVALLSVIIVVVSIITVTMASLFRTDKTAYIRDLTSIMALTTAEESYTIISGYRERIHVFARVMFDDQSSANHKANMLKGLFQDFGDIIAVTLYENGVEGATVYDANTLQTAGISNDQLYQYRQQHLPPFEQIEKQKVFVTNSTISEKLPTLTLSSLIETTNSATPIIISAVIKLNSLLKLAGRSKVVETFLIDANGRLLAHSNLQLVAQRIPVDWIPELVGVQGQQSLGTTVEYSHNGIDVVGAFAPVQLGGLKAGVQIPKSAAYLTARELLSDLIITAFVLLSISAVLGLFWSRRLTRPIEELSKAAVIIGKGDFNVSVKKTSGDEIGILGDSFNKMAHGLMEREEALAGAQAALVQSEKMAAFGQLGAGIAHEVKNPLAGILGYAQLSLRKVDEGSTVYKNLQVIEKETKRCKVIIENLMKFARQEPVSYEPMEINEVIEDAMAIVDHQLTINQIRLEKNLAPDLPYIMGNSNQIQQVLMNFMINAQQAMDGSPGLVKITTRLANANQIEIQVRDTGPGIPKEIQSKLFEPFFTTKPAGKGTGLGLSVSYGIIKDHKGNIAVASSVGNGATFLIRLPIVSEQQEPEPASAINE